jgi:hypothetical protein
MCQTIVQTLPLASVTTVEVVLLGVPARLTKTALPVWSTAFPVTSQESNGATVWVPHSTNLSALTQSYK